MSNNTSMIDATITNMLTSKGSNATLAQLVQAQQHDQVANRIAMTYASLVAERARLKVLDKSDNGTRVKDMPVKPEQLFSFIQFTMNMICWGARRLLIETRKEDLEKTQTSAEVTDFSANIAEQLNIEPADVSGIHDAVDQDYMMLNGVYFWLQAPGRMDYLESVDSLFVFAESEKDEETGHWNLSEAAMSFDEALGIMDAALERMDTEQQAKVATDAANTDFSELAFSAAS